MNKPNKMAATLKAAGLGVTPEYVSMVLNGHREPGRAEERFRAALAQLIAEQKNSPAG